MVKKQRRDGSWAGPPAKKHKRGRKSARKFEPIPNAEARSVVQWFRACGADCPTIIERTGLSHDFVYRWADREGTAILPGRGPKPLISDDQAACMVKAVLKVRFHGTDRLREEVINPQTGEKVCRQTVCDALARAGLISKRVVKGQMLTAAQKERRLAWCLEHKKAKSVFRDWIFSDEKWWCVGGVQGNERMWVLAEDPFPDELFVPTVSNP